jgi:hypothetical protein
MGGDSEPPRRGSYLGPENPPPRCDVPSDEKKHDLNQVFKSWDREHREPASPVSEEEVYVISDAERKFMRDEARFHRVASETLSNLANKARQKAFAAEQAAIEAELDAEFEQTPERKKDVSTTPRRSLEPTPPADPKPRKTDIKRPLTVEEIATARRDEVVQLYDLLKRLAGLPSVNKSESALRIKFGDALKPLWDAIDQSTTLTAKDRKLFFRQLTNAGEHERYEFIANLLGSTPDAVRGWRFPRKTKTKTPA